MTTTMNAPANGRPRRSLNETIGHLDQMLCIGYPAAKGFRVAGPQRLQSGAFAPDFQSISRREPFDLPFVPYGR